MTDAAAIDIRVLHVDDDPDFSALTAAYLEREDDRFVVDTATRAAEGLDRLAADPPDCIVSDYNMPAMDGLEFLERVRETRPDLPFILFTGKGSEAVASDAISAGVTDYLQKAPGTEQYELLANRITNAVTARRDAERASRQEELMRLTELVGDTGGWQLDLSADDFLLTEGARRLVDVPDDVTPSLDDVIGWFHPDDRDAARGSFDRAIETGEETRGTWRLQRTDERERLVDVTIVPVVVDGDVSLLRGAVHDITERRDREQRFRAFVEQSNDVISVVDEEGRFTYQSPSLERILGYDPADTIGDLAFEYIHPDDRERLVRLFEESVTDPDATPEMEYRARHADGSWRWIEAIGNHQMDNPAVEGYIVNSRDVTDRKEREAELERLKAQYQTLVENVPNGGIYLFDEDFEYQLAGGAGLSTVGLSADDFEGTTPHGVFPEAVADETVAHYREALNGTPTTFERELDGEHYLVQTLPIRNDEGEVVSGMAVSQNITERKRREVELTRQNERLEEFASMVSHDLRNPLNVAQGRLELLAETCESDDIPIIRAALDRSQALIDDLLTLAHRGTRVGDPEPVVLAAAAEACWRTVATGGATLDVESSRTILADRSRLGQLLENLIRNSVEHGSGGGDVCVTVGTLPDGFYVEDDGPGIPEDERDRVSEAGYSTAGSLGFGLRIVEQVVDAHGWTLTITDGESGGARFEVSGVESP